MAWGITFWPEAVTVIGCTAGRFLIRSSWALFLLSAILSICSAVSELLLLLGKAEGGGSMQKGTGSSPQQTTQTTSIPQGLHSRNRDPDYVDRLVSEHLQLAS